MILNTGQKTVEFAPVEFAPQPPSFKSGIQFSLSRKCINLTAACLAIAGVLSIAPSAFSQAAPPPTAVQPSTCMDDPQGLMCSSQRELDETTAPQQTVPLLPALSNAQMERLADVLLGLLYFVLPIGFGLGLFLHDRHQAYRLAMLEAQIKLLEKLWEQTPQA